MSQVIWFLGGLTFALLCGFVGVAIAYLLFSYIPEVLNRKQGDSDA